ncbi:class II aldolase/adducin family protein [candidate division KSB1 bacterium]|nr:class II aldolase/adducin family protein [candidate division KSB1 bacterium]
MKLYLLHPRDQIVDIMNRIYNNGMTTLSGGNLSIRDDNGDIWITPAGIDKGKLQPSDIMCVKKGGAVIGKNKVSSEYPFHRWIYEKRPDLNAIVHAHSPALVSFSITRQIPDTNIIPQANRICGKVGYAPYALPGSEQLGENIANTFSEGFNVVLLENHGVATGGEDLLNAFHRLETLEFCARTILQARRLGNISTLNDEQISFFDHRQNSLPEIEVEKHSSRERELRKEIVDIVHRACDRYLMISTEGVVSSRVDDHSFLITPTGMGRRSFELQDIVLIINGKREKGKNPSRSVLLHEAIYKANKDINCIISSQTPNATAYAIADHKLDTRTIPESYVVLRDIQLIPYGQQYKEPDKIAEIISHKNPVLLIKNECILIAGRSILEAFDRLEVADFTARSIIDSLSIGKLAPIGKDEVDELNAHFLGSN